MVQELENELRPLILVVDDEVEIARLLETILKRKKYQVIAAYDGESALEQTRTHNPDLILLDAYLPKKNGCEVCHILKSDRSTKYIPIIMMTASTDLKTKQECYDFGADEFINKPFETFDLLARVNAMLRIKSLEDELLETNKDLNDKVIEKTRELESLYMQTLRSLARTIDAKDHYTSRHSSFVADYATLIAREMCLTDSEISEIEEAAEFHDLGKLSIPDKILRKKGKLTEEEWGHIKDHPVASVEILGPLIFLESTLEAIRQHHERYDGSGYPFGNKGENIPLKARIIAVADAYEAMTSDRPYRKALIKEKAIEELQNNAGKQFDPRVVEIFITILKSDKKVLKKKTAKIQERNNDNQ